MHKLELINNNNITLIQNDNEIILKKDQDNSIWLMGNKMNNEINISVCSHEYDEFKTYQSFYELMKSIFGQYILKDYQSTYNGLPDDFINIDDKEIIIHSDNFFTSYLKLKLKNGIININLVKEKNRDSRFINNSIKINSFDSQYSRYFSSFDELYKNLDKYTKKKQRNKQKRLQK